MEFERAYVAFFVFFRFVKTFFELPVFLKPVFLSHCLFFVVGFHNTAFLSEFPEFSVKNLVFSEFALERSVVERNLYRRLQSYLVEAFRAVAEHPSVVVEELVFQSFSYHSVCSEQVGRGDAFPVWRVGHHDALLLRLLEVLEVGTFYGDAVGESCSFDVKPCGVYSFHVYVVSIDMEFVIPFLRVVVVDGVEEVAVEVRPFFECELFSEQSWSHVFCYQCSLYGYCARTAHGVDEVGVAFPSCQEYDSCSEHFVEWSLHAFLSVSASV